MIGDRVALRPLEISDARKLWGLIGNDTDTWRWDGSGAPVPSSAKDLHDEFLRKINRPDSEYFTIIDKQSDTVISSIAFLDIREVDRHFEIGSISIAPTFRGGGRNIEAKYLMLTQAFENRGAVRIKIKANAANLRSRKAIEKIGAKLEGLLRNQRQERDGTWHTAAYHSVIVKDLPETKANLEKLHSLQN